MVDIKKSYRYGLHIKDLGKKGDCEKSPFIALKTFYRDLYLKKGLCIMKIKREVIHEEEHSHSERLDSKNPLLLRNKSCPVDIYEKCINRVLEFA